MSNLRLNQIIRYDEPIDSEFIVADVVRDSGYKEPDLITTLEQLNLKYRHCSKYFYYKYLLQSGIHVKVVCAAEDEYFEDFPTLCITDHDIIKYCYPKYSNDNSYYDNLNLDYDSFITNWKPDIDYVYKFNLRIINEINKLNYITIPILNPYNSNQLSYLFLIFGDGINDSVPLEITKDYNKLYITTDQVITIDLIYDKLNEWLEEHHDYLVDDESNNCYWTFYKNEDTIEFIYKNIVRTLYSKDDDIEFKPDIRFTQDVYYLKSYNNRVLELRSKLLGYSGRVLGLSYIITNDFCTLELSSLGNTYNFSGYLLGGNIDNFNDELINNKVDNEIFEIVYSRISSKQLKGITTFNSFYKLVPTKDPDLISKAIDQFNEYDESFTVVLVDYNEFSEIKYDESGITKPIVNKFIKLAEVNDLGSTKTYRNVLVAIYSTSTIEELLISNLYKYERTHLFTSVLDNIPSVFHYLKYWLKDKRLLPIKGSTLISTEYTDSLYIYRDTYNLSFKQSSEFIKNILVSYINYRLSTVAQPDILSNLISNISTELSRIKDKITRIQDLYIESYESTNNEVVINITNNYQGEVLDIIVNFKIT